MKFFWNILELLFIIMLTIALLIIYRKWSLKAKLVSVIKVKIIIHNIKSIVIVLTCIAIFILLISSSIWLEGIKLSIENSSIRYAGVVSDLISDNMDILNSMIGIAIGSVLVFFATYIVGKREEKRKILGSKEIAFYTPMLAELVKIATCMNKFNVIDFEKDGNSYQDKVIWRFYEDISSTMIKFYIPDVFSVRINRLDKNIREYMMKREEYILHFRLYVPTKLVKFGYKGGDESVFWNVFEDAMNEREILPSYRKGAFSDDANLEEINNHIIEVIKNSKEHTDFCRQHENVLENVCELIEGINYIANKIYTKYKSKNQLL